MDFSIIDFLIGFFLMTAMPHFVLGIYKGRILSPFGYGDRKNIFFSFTCLALSLGLFHIKYGIAFLFYHEMFVGALTILLIYYFVGKNVYEKFHVKHLENENKTSISEVL